MYILFEIETKRFDLENILFILRYIRALQLEQYNVNVNAYFVGEDRSSRNDKIIER